MSTALTRLSPSKVFDPADGSMIARTDEDHLAAQVLFNIANISSNALAVALHFIMERKYYLDYGYASFNDFVEARLDVGSRQAHRYLQKGRMISRFMGAAGAMLATAESPEEFALQLVNAQEEAGLGDLKDGHYYALARLEDDEIDGLATEGKLRLPDGRELTWDDIRRMQAKEFDRMTAEVRRERDAYKALSIQKEEEIRKIKSENAEDREKAKEAEERLKRAEHLERLYSDAARSYDQQKAATDEIVETVALLRRQVANAGIEETEDPTILEPLGHALRDVYKVWQMAYAYYDWAIDNEAPAVVASTSFTTVPEGDGL